MTDFEMCVGIMKLILVDGYVVHVKNAVLVENWVVKHNRAKLSFDTFFDMDYRCSDISS